MTCGYYVLQFLVLVQSRVSDEVDFVYFFLPLRCVFDALMDGEGDDF